MKFLDLEAQYLTIKNEIDDAIQSVISRGDFIMGEKVKELEQQIANYCGVKYAVALNSGTDALYGALKALQIGPGDEVIVPDFTYIATAEVVLMAGATPVFVDIDPKTYNIDPNLIEQSITEKTKAIIPVHLYGLPAEMDRIITIAKKHDIYVVEDAAQAIGAEYNGKRVGSFGDVGCLSFFPTKNLGAYGDGGMLVTNNRDIAEYASKWRIHGQSKKYFTDFTGVSSRLDTMQAAILLTKLKYLDKWTQARIEIAQRYDDFFSTTNIQFTKILPGYKHVYHQYSIKTEKRDDLKKFLSEKGIPTMIYYPLPLHQQKAFKASSKAGESYNFSTHSSKEVLSLPIYPELKQTEIESVIENIRKFIS